MFYFDSQSCNTAEEIENVIDACATEFHTCIVNNLNRFSTIKKTPECSKLQPFFSSLPAKVIKKIFEKTTQYARTTASTILHKNYKSPFATLSIHKRKGFSLCV